GRTLLPLRERFLDLADLGPSEMADLGRDRVEGRGGDRERRHELGVTVARDDLARGLGGAQPEPGAHLLLDARIDLRVRADRPADRADAHGLARPPEPVAVAVELERPERRLVAEAGRLRDDPM